VFEKHAEVKRFFSSLRTSDVFAFLRAEESSTTALHLPRTSSTIQEKDVCASALEVVKVGAPIRVREAIENKTVGVVSAVDDTQVLGFDEVARYTNVGVKMFLRGVVNITAEHANTMSKVRSSPNRHVNVLSVGAEDALFDFSVDSWLAISFAVREVRI
jgi:hypothetical protein